MYEGPRILIADGAKVHTPCSYGDITGILFGIVLFIPQSQIDSYG